MKTQFSLPSLLLLWIELDMLCVYMSFWAMGPAECLCCTHTHLPHPVCTQAEGEAVGGGEASNLLSSPPKK